MEATTLIKNQKRQIRKDITINGDPVTLIVEVRHDDECGNGHNSFAITCDQYEKFPQRGEPTVKHSSGKTLWLSSCGCLHDVVNEHFPELAHLIRWHLCSTDGPMHYVANAVYHASDRDYRGLLKGERRQLISGKTNLPVWERVIRDACGKVEIGSRSWTDSAEQPTDQLTCGWEPVMITGEGKERDLKAARSCAVWPDATDEELTAPGLKERLDARIPALMTAFKADVEAFGFTF